MTCLSRQWAVVLILWTVGWVLAEPKAHLVPPERSYWVHASLGQFTQLGYYGTNYPATTLPTRDEVAHAAHLLSDVYGANRLYLIYHNEMPERAARTVFTWWREVCPASVELVPALVLRMYDKQQTPVFAAGEARGLATFFHDTVNSNRLAVYDIQARRDQGDALPVLAQQFPGGMIRLGLQPGESLDAPFTAAVQDTWSGFCHGTRTREDWSQPGFGAEALRSWVAERNAGSAPVAWNLIVVAWDYSVTPRGGYPGYDDAAKNMPLPSGRNRAAAQLILKTASLDRFGGFSSDLYILHENSRSAAHDGKTGAFYQTLREGRAYEGYYAVPFREVAAIYREVEKGAKHE